MPTKFTHVGSAEIGQYDGLKQGKNGSYLLFTLDTGLQCVKFGSSEEDLALIKSGPIECEGEIVLKKYKSYRGPQGKVSSIASAARPDIPEWSKPEELSEIEPF